MNRKLNLGIAILLTIALSAGCIENMTDLKERLGAAEATPEPVEPAATIPDEEPEELVPVEPPVARITVFGANGALVYKAGFTAEDVEEPIFTQLATLKLIATESQTLEPGAELIEYTWTINGETKTGAQTDHELADAGIYEITLTVKDDHNSTDSQNITLAVMPQPFDIVTTVTTGPVIGAAGEGIGSDATYTLSHTIQDKLHTVTSLKFATHGGQNCDTMMEIIQPDGTTTGIQDTGHDETITFSDAAEGAWTINITGYACASQAVDIEVTATYLQIIEGLEDDGHGGHAH